MQFEGLWNLFVVVVCNMNLHVGKDVAVGGFNIAGVWS